MEEFGPFFRVNMSDEVAEKIVKSGELWGRAPFGSGTPQPQAYVGRLDLRRRGIEFYTNVAPHPDTAPGQARWWPGDPGVVKIDDKYAKIAIRVTQNTHKRR